METTAKILAAVLLASQLAACNTTMLDETAPEITGSEWVLPPGEQAPPLDHGWRVLAFFAPT